MDPYVQPQNIDQELDLSPLELELFNRSYQTYGELPDITQHAIETREPDLTALVELFPDNTLYQNGLSTQHWPELFFPATSPDYSFEGKTLKICKLCLTQYRLIIKFSFISST